MSVEGYFWLLLLVILAATAGLFLAGWRIGASQAGRGGSIAVGGAILVITGILCGGGKALESKYGTLVLYEGGMLASALNFALAGGYIAGKKRGSTDRSRRAVPILCALIAIASLFLMASKLHRLVEVLNELGVGARKEKPAGPDTSLDCKQSLAKIYAGFVHYVQVNDALPPAEKWMEEEDLRGAVQADEWFHCPTVSSRKDDRFGYAYNDALAGRKLNGKPLAGMPDAAKTPLVYDSSNLAKSAHDAFSSLPKPGRHGGRNNILFCDGHIETVAPP